MPRARLVLVVVFLVAAAGVVAYLGAPNTCACSPTLPPLPPSPVVGVVTNVESASLGDVKAFTILTPDRRTIELLLGQLENAKEFSPSHLTEHQASSEPIRAFYRLVNDVAVVYRLEDASP